MDPVNTLSAKLVGIKYPKAGATMDLNREREPECIYDINDLKIRIKHLLFNVMCDQVLVFYKNGLYVCEKTEFDYTRRPVNYHPLESLVKF